MDILDYRNTCLLIILIVVFSCAKEKKAPIIKTSTESKTKQIDSTIKKAITINKAQIDSVSINEMKRFAQKEHATIFDYYKEETTGDNSTWSEKLFGRCCSNTDITFTENLFFKISSNFVNTTYPISNISDNQYLTAFVFKKEFNVTINLQLDLDQSYLEGKYANKNILDANVVIMNPIRLSLINGYVKSEALFDKNSRVKEMDFYVNEIYQETVVLLDTPKVQELTVNAVFKTNDVITLIPKSYYQGSTYSDICISEIQTNLGKTALSSLNKKFNLMELLNKPN